MVVDYCALWTNKIKVKAVAAGFQRYAILAYPGHMAFHAEAARAVCLMVGMFTDAAFRRAFRGISPVAGKAEAITWFIHHCGILTAVRIVAVKTLYTPAVHLTLDKIISLIPIFPRYPVFKKLV